MSCLCKPLLNSHVFHRSPICLAIDGSVTVHFGELGTQLPAYLTEVLSEKGKKKSRHVHAYSTVLFFRTPGIAILFNK